MFVLVTVQVENQTERRYDGRLSALAPQPRQASGRLDRRLGVVASASTDVARGKPPDNGYFLRTTVTRADESSSAVTACRALPDK